MIEARPQGRAKAYRRHLEFPDGTVLRLPEQPVRTDAQAAARPRRRARG